VSRLQDVLATISDEEAMAVWHALAAHVENELCSLEVSQERWDNPTGGPCEAVVSRLDAVVAGLAG